MVNRSGEFEQFAPVNTGDFAILRAGAQRLPSGLSCGKNARVNFAENLNSIRERIAAACARAGREPSSVTLLAVSKSHPPETIRTAVAAGQLLFGENKIQEAKAKIPLCPGRARWQFIGHLQSNKVRDAVAWFELIQGVDSLAIAEEISRRAVQAAKTMPILLEVNVAGEGSKFGYRPEQLLKRGLNVVERWHQV